MNGAQLVGPAQKTVTINQQGEHRLDWQMTAPQTGQVTLLAKALTNTESDAVELMLDVVPRGLHETKVERWVTTDDAAEQQFTLEVYVNGETLVAEHVGDASAARTFLLNRKGSAVGPVNQIRIVKRGRGTVYFSGAVEYYTEDENVAARGSSELSVSREYYRLKIQQAGYNLKWTTVPLTGEIRSGDLLVVKLRRSDLRLLSHKEAQKAQEKRLTDLCFLCLFVARHALSYAAIRGRVSANRN